MTAFDQTAAAGGIAAPTLESHPEKWRMPQAVLRSPMKIYNLFPRLVGRFSAWLPHLERAAAMGFDWIYINPIQRVGRSGSLYAIADYFAIDPWFVDPDGGTAAEQLQAVVERARALGQSLMIDLVINHCAIDSPLVATHPEWFVRKRGRPVSPFCLEPDGSKTVWEDLAQFAHRKTTDAAGLFDYCVAIAEHLIALGFRGFRCDAAYQIPTDFWRRFIARVREKHPEIILVAETLGCTPQQTQATAAAGFDAVYNSVKWWDFVSSWLLEQYDLIRPLAGSIGFPESHDTPRLWAEMHGNVAALKQRYLFAALFSQHILMPIGFEFGFHRRLHVVETRPEHWETPNVDLTGFIAQVNAIKNRHPVFAGEGAVRIVPHENPAILIMHKRALQGPGEGLLIVNRDPWQRQHCYIADLYRLIDARPPLLDLSPDWPMEYLPTPYHFELGPGMARVLVTELR